MPVASSQPETTSPSFEEALTQLQQHVLDLERGSLSLEETISTFRSASELATACQKMIAEAELRIIQLTDAEEDEIDTKEPGRESTGS